MLILTISYGERIFELKMTTKVIVATTNKGGDGKTKSSILTAEYLSAVKHKKGLAIDLDPQCNFSSRFLQMEIDPVSKDGKVPPLHSDYDPKNQEDAHWSGRSSIADIFYGDPIIPYDTHVDNLEIAPGHGSKLLEAEAVTRHEVMEKVHLQIKNFIQLPEVQGLYDYIIIDTPPSKGPLTIAAFKAATHILIPAQMEEYSIQGIYGMLQLWKQETYCRTQSEPIDLIGILPNKVRGVNLHRDFLDGLKSSPGISDYVMPCYLKERTIYAEVDVESASPRTIFDLHEAHVAKQEATKVCEYIYDRVFNHG